MTHVLWITYCQYAYSAYCPQTVIHADHVLSTWVAVRESQYVIHAVRESEYVRRLAQWLRWGFALWVLLKATLGIQLFFLLRAEGARWGAAGARDHPP